MDVIQCRTWCKKGGRRENGMSQRSWILVLAMQKILMLLLWIGTAGCKAEGSRRHRLYVEQVGEAPQSHSCIHDHILEHHHRFQCKEYLVTPQTYGDESGFIENHRKWTEQLVVANKNSQLNEKNLISIFLNYDAVGHSLEKYCRNIGDIVELREPPIISNPGVPVCDPHAEPPVYGDCWYKYTSEDVSREDKKMRLHEKISTSRVRDNVGKLTWEFV